MRFKMELYRDHCRDKRPHVLVCIAEDEYEIAIPLETGEDGLMESSHFFSMVHELEAAFKRHEENLDEG
jgi:hypothetical protein